MTYQEIPLSKLSVSDQNARTTPAEKQADKELKASVKENGILQNLIVQETDDGYKVIAGGRRLGILGALVSEGHLDSNYPVPCSVYPADASVTEISLAENLARADMHPVDQLEAFNRLSKLAGGTMSVADIAAHFGKSRNEVRKILALGTCAPELLILCREGKLDVDILRAFSIEPDQKKQLAAYEAVKESTNISEWAVRNYLTQDKIAADDKRVKFVTLAAYEKAGGGVQKDLFQQEVYLLDENLLDELVDQKAKELAGELGEGWGFCRVDLDAYPHSVRARPRLEGELTDEGETISQELADHKASMEVLDAKMDAELANDPDIDLSDMHKQFEEHEKKARELADQIGEHVIYSDEDKQRAGVIVTIEHDGTPTVFRGVLGDGETGTAAGSAGAAEADGDQGDSAGKPEHSAAMLRDLEVYRAEIARSALTKHSSLAVELIHFSVIAKLLREGAERYEYSPQILGLRYEPNEEDTAKNDIAALQVRKERRSDIDSLFSLVPNDFKWHLADDEFGIAFQKFIAWPDNLKEQLLAHAAAITLCVRTDAADVLLHLTDTYVCDHWRPTAANYFGRIRKETALEVAREIMGETWADGLKDMPKKDIAIRLEEVCEAGRPGEHWLPRPMQQSFICGGGEEEDPTEAPAEAVEQQLDIEDEPQAATA